jgi:enediyne biosynthesis protein E4
VLVVVSLVGHSQPFDKLHTQVGLSHQFSASSSMGGGVVVLDFNNDGYMDLYLPGGRLLDKLFLNINGQLFSNISFSAGILQTGTANTQGGASGDFNNDGWEDLFITTQRKLDALGNPTVFTSNFLLLNNGDNTFTEIGESAGIIHESYSVAPTLGDFNHDGWLDIYVVNYVAEVGFLYDSLGEVSGFDHQCMDNYYYEGSAQLSFEEKAAEFGLNDAGCGLAAIATDYNWDGYTDLMVVNDFGEFIQPNLLYQNQGTSFSDVSAASGANIGLYGMGVASGDFNEDGLLDYYITNLGRNALLLQLPNHTFVDVTAQAGVENEFVNNLLTTGWSAFFFDYDNDSYLDLFVSNGQMPAAGFIATGIYDPNKLFRNLGNGTFEDVSELLGVADTSVGRGAAYLDFNNDGRLDIVQMNIPSPFNMAFNQPVLYLNQTENDNNWVMFSLKGTTANSSAIGARMELYASGRKFIREVDGGSGFASHNDKRLHFGLGEISAIDSAIVFWPGIVHAQIIHNPEINQIHLIVQEDVITNLDEQKASWNIFPNPARDKIQIQFVETAAEPQEIQLIDMNGRVIQQSTLPAGFSGVFSIQTPASTGIYIIRISNSSGQTHKRLSVIR